MTVMLRYLATGILLIPLSVISSATVSAGDVTPGYLNVLDSFDFEVPDDYARMLTEADGLAARFEDRVRKAKAKGGEKVTDEQYLRAVMSLGDLSQRVRGGLAWADLGERTEQRNKAEARMEVRRRNQRERQRVYEDFVAGVLARRGAARDLWGLATGRARVARQNLYDGSISQATPQETAEYVERLKRLARSPIVVRPAQRTNMGELYSYERLEQLRELRSGASRLGALIDRELKRLSDGHLVRVEMAIRRGGADRLMGVSTLGWWNGARGKAIIDACLEDDSEEVRAAAHQALARLRLGTTSLSRFAEHPEPSVRAAAAEIAVSDRAFVDDPRPVFEALRELMIDPDETVRGRALAAFDQLASIHETSATERIRALTPMLGARQRPEIVLEVLNRLTFWDREAYACPELFRHLQELVNDRDESVKMAAKRLWEEAIPVADPDS